MLVYRSSRRGRRTTPPTPTPTRIMSTPLRLLRDEIAPREERRLTSLVDAAGGPSPNLPYMVVNPEDRHRYAVRLCYGKSNNFSNVGRYMLVVRGFLFFSSSAVYSLVTVLQWR